MRFAIVDSTSLKVVNVCEWEGAEWLPPFGSFIVQSDRGGVGDDFDPISNEIKPIDRTASDPVEDKV